MKYIITNVFPKNIIILGKSISPGQSIELEETEMTEGLYESENKGIISISEIEETDNVKTNKRSKTKNNEGE